MAKEEMKKEKEEASIVRMSGIDINGNFKMQKALMQIKGVGQNMANALSIAIKRTYGIEKSTKIGSLSDEQIAQVELIIKDPGKAHVPSFLLNRRKDLDQGLDLHLVGTDLSVRTRQDVDNDVKLQTWRGFRHQHGQKARGQRTRSTGRTGVTVGVTKKVIQEQAKAAAAAAKEEKK
jgi:small subunit ribosomal protein S13